MDPTLEPSNSGIEHVLVIIDQFSRYAQAYPIKNMMEKITAEITLLSTICLPKRFHSDQGANFIGKIMQEICQMFKVEKSCIMSYHPMGNGIYERFNRTLCNILGSLEPESKSNWKTHWSTHTIAPGTRLQECHISSSCLGDTHVCRSILPFDWILSQENQKAFFRITNLWEIAYSWNMIWRPPQQDNRNSNRRSNMTSRQE